MGAGLLTHAGLSTSAVIEMAMADPLHLPPRDQVIESPSGVI